MTKLTDTRNLVLGIDIGSVSLSIVQLDQDGNILKRFHKFHKGNLLSSLSEATKVFDIDQITSAACTSSSTCLNKKLVKNYNSQVAIIATARHLCINIVWKIFQVLNSASLFNAYNLFVFNFPSDFYARMWYHINLVQTLFHGRGK